MNMFQVKVICVLATLICSLFAVFHKSTMDKYAQEVILVSSKCAQTELEELIEREESEIHRYAGLYYEWCERGKHTKDECKSKRQFYKSKQDAAREIYRKKRDAVMAERDEFEKRVMYRVKTFDKSIQTTESEKRSIKRFEDADCKLMKLDEKDRDMIMGYFLRASKKMPTR